MSEIGKRDHDFERAVEGMDEMTVLSMYYAQRNRSESAEQRAQRDEAECERLRGVLKDVMGTWRNGTLKEMNDLAANGGKIDAALEDATPPPEGEPHPDDAAVDRFAEAMKAKLAKAREKGRGGWDDPEQCPAERLAVMLIEHLQKGNEGTFEDVANFAMMLHQRGEAPETLALAWLAADKEASDRGYRYAMKAAAPEQARTELVGQVYELVDQIERTLHFFGGDDEGRSQAIGAIDHARRVAAPYNYNGGTPEQAHGDALAAAEESLRFLEGDGYRVSPRLVRHHHDIIRQALTASGVPEDASYCPCCTQEMEKYSVTHCPSCDVVVGGPAIIHQWAGDASRALASAPAMPGIPESVVDEIVDEFEWMAEDEDGRDASRTPADWERLMLKDFAMLLLSEAPNRIAAAPTDGRE